MKLAQEAGEGKRGRESGELSGLRAGVQATSLRAVQDVRVAAPGARVYPGCGARVDEVRAEDAAEEEGREAEGGLEGPFDQVLAYGEAVEAEEDWGGRPGAGGLGCPRSKGRG